MSNKNLFKEAIADAKAVREAALANAKAALEEALTPKLQSMLAAKLQEMEDVNEAITSPTQMSPSEYKEFCSENPNHPWCLSETKKSDKKEKMEEVDYSSTGQSSDDIWHTRAHAASQSDAIAESEELEEDFDLSEILAELNEDDSEEKTEYEELEEAEEKEEEEETEEEEEVEVKDMTIEDLKDLIKDIVSQEMGDEEPSMEMGGEEEPVEMGGEEEMPAAGGDEDEIDLEELLAELDSLNEDDDDLPEPPEEYGGIKGGMVGERKLSKKEKEEKEEKKKKTMKEAIDPEILGAIGGFAGIVSVGYGLATLMIKSAKKEIADKFRKAGQPVPDDKELEKLAAASVKGGLDKATGGASFDQSTPFNEELAEAIDTINTLRSELNEVNLLNAKLLYVNKIFKAKNLTESQKVKVIASFDKATNVKEAKVVFESLQTALTAAPKKQIKESLGFASKAAGVAPNKTIVESNDVIARMQKLANIK